MRPRLLTYSPLMPPRRRSARRGWGSLGKSARKRCTGSRLRRNRKSGSMDGMLRWSKKWSVGGVAQRSFLPCRGTSLRVAGTEIQGRVLMTTFPDALDQHWTARACWYSCGEAPANPSTFLYFLCIYPAYQRSWFIAYRAPHTASRAFVHYIIFRQNYRQIVGQIRCLSLNPITFNSYFEIMKSFYLSFEYLFWRLVGFAALRCTTLSSTAFPRTISRPHRSDSASHLCSFPSLNLSFDSRREEWARI